jgi:hypothetical protein
MSRGVVEVYEQLVAEGYLQSRYGGGTRALCINSRAAGGLPVDRLRHGCVVDLHQVTNFMRGVASSPCGFDSP